MNKTEDEAYNLIEHMTLNNFQRSSERTQSKRVRGKLELDAISMLSSKVDAMSKKLECLNVNSINSSIPSPSCNICGSFDHFTVHGQVGSPFTQYTSEQVNYMNNYDPRPTNDPFFGTYNPGWRNHRNFSYSSNAPLVPQMNFRPTLGFQVPTYPQQAPQKSNL